MNRRITKKHYKRMLAELAEEKEYVGAQLAEVNEMHSRAVRHLNAEINRLKQQVAGMRAVDGEMPRDYNPRTACADFMLHRDYEGRMPYFRFTCARYERLSGNGIDNYRARMEVNKNDFPLDRRHIFLLEGRFREMLQFLFNDQEKGR